MDRAAGGVVALTLRSRRYWARNPTSAVRGEPTCAVALRFRCYFLNCGVGPHRGLASAGEPEHNFPEKHDQDDRHDRVRGRSRCGIGGDWTSIVPSGATQVTAARMDSHAQLPVCSPKRALTRLASVHDEEPVACRRQLSSASTESAAARGRLNDHGFRRHTASGHY